MPTAEEKAAKVAARKEAAKLHAAAKRKAQKKVTKPKKVRAAHCAADGLKVEGAPNNWPFGTQPEKPEVNESASSAEESEGLDPNLQPLEFLLMTMRDPRKDLRTRLQAAQIAAPFVHTKKGEGGKKEQREEAAKTVASRFAQSAPPRVVAIGGKKV